MALVPLSIARSGTSLLVDVGVRWRLWLYDEKLGAVLHNCGRMLRHREKLSTGPGLEVRKEVIYRGVTSVHGYEHGENFFLTTCV